jgi:hypothetical protein
MSLCPFIGAHLQPVHHIVPFIPLFLPNSQWKFHLLYTIKENVHAHSDSHIIWIAVFMMTSPRHDYPTLVGTQVPESFINTIQSNVTFQRRRAREAADQACFSIW